MSVSTVAEYAASVKRGYAGMAGSRVVLCGIVRDSEAALKRNIPMIERLRSRFRATPVVIIENDSRDGTKDVLRSWANSSRDVHIVSEDLQQEPIQRGVAEGVQGAFSRHRIQLMSGFRNKYLDYLDHHGIDCDYLIVTDLDLHAIELDGIAHSFGQDIDWDCMAANGRAYGKSSWLKSLYHDAYAVREYRDRRPQTLRAISAYQIALSDLSRGMPLMHVSSAFGGLALYKAAAIAGLRYRWQPNDDDIVASRCEHVTLHADMARKGFDRIFINPSQLVFYNTRFGLLRFESRHKLRKLTRSVRRITGVGQTQ